MFKKKKNLQEEYTQITPNQNNPDCFKKERFFFFKEGQSHKICNEHEEPNSMANIPSTCISNSI